MKALIWPHTFGPHDLDYWHPVLWQRTPGSYSRETRWRNGKAESRAWSGNRRPRWKRDRSMDFGTPLGDLIIDPWMQEALRQE